LQNAENRFFSGPDKGKEASDLYKKKFQVLQDFAHAVVVADDIQSIADAFLNSAIRYADAEKSSFMILRGTDELALFAWRGFEPDDTISCIRKVGEGIAGMVAHNRVSLLVRDIELEYPGLRFRQGRYATASFISCPIIMNAALLGVINISDKRDGSPFTHDECELLQTLANHAAMAMHHAGLRDQLRAKAGELEEMNRILRETDGAKTDFLTRMSHELRTPLNSLKGAIYFLQNTKKIFKQDLHEFHGIIAKETDALVSIVEGLLTFLRQPHR